MSNGLLDNISQLAVRKLAKKVVKISHDCDRSEAVDEVFSGIVNFIDDIKIPDVNISPIKINARKRAIKITDIQDVVCGYYDVNSHLLHEKNRHPNIVRCRSIICYVAKELTYVSTTVLGRFFNQDHSTVISGINVLKNRMDTEGEVRIDVRSIVEIVIELCDDPTS